MAVLLILVAVREAHTPPLITHEEVCVVIPHCPDVVGRSKVQGHGSGGGGGGGGCCDSQVIPSCSCFFGRYWSVSRRLRNTRF